MASTLRRLPPLFLAALVAACGPAPQLEPVAPDATLLAFGDSLTRGVGADPAESYPAVLAGLSGREVVNAGVPGELSGEGRKRLPAVLDRIRPALLLLCHGGNDLLQRVPADRLRENLLGMVRTARARDIPVVLIGVPKPAVFGSGSAGVYHEVAETLEVPLLAEALAEIERDAGLKSDPIHPNARGYRRLAEAVHRLLVERGALPVQ